MTAFQKMKPTLLIVSALVLGVISASIAKADHNWKYDVRDHADEMIHTSIAIRQEILHVAKNSRVFGQMLSETGLMEGNSAILKGWTYHREPCHLREQAEKIHENVHHLAALLAEARFRSDSGLDRRMPCSDELERLLGIMEANVTHALSDIPSIVAYRPVVVAPTPIVVQNQYRVIDNRPNFGPTTTLQFGNNGPGFGGPSVQVGVGPRLNIQLNLGGKPRFNPVEHQGHGHHQDFGRVNKGQRDQHPQNGNGKVRKTAAVATGGTNIYGGRAVVSQFAGNNPSKRGQKGSANTNHSRNHSNHR